MNRPEATLAVLPYGRPRGDRPRGPERDIIGGQDEARTRHGARKPAMPDGPSDENLMAQVAAGDHAAFRGLMARHMSRAIRVAQGIVTSAADADDIAQEAFLRVWNRARSFDPAIAKFTTWMHQIVVNLAIDRTRRPTNEPLELAEDVADAGPGALALLIDAEERQAMNDALARLPASQRAAVTLFHFEGLSGRESAQVLSLSESAFESLLGRARLALRQNVQAALHNEGRNP